MPEHLRVNRIFSITTFISLYSYSTHTHTFRHTYIHTFMQKNLSHWKLKEERVKNMTTNVTTTSKTIYTRSSSDMNNIYSYTRVINPSTMLCCLVLYWYIDTGVYICMYVHLCCTFQKIRNKNYIHILYMHSCCSWWCCKKDEVIVRVTVGKYVACTYMYMVGLETKSKSYFAIINIRVMHEWCQAFVLNEFMWWSAPKWKNDVFYSRVVPFLLSPFEFCSLIFK